MKYKVRFRANTDPDDYEIFDNLEDAIRFSDRFVATEISAIEEDADREATQQKPGSERGGNETAH